MSGERKLDQITLEAAVIADAGGWASDFERTELGAEPLAWAAALRRLIHQTDDGIRQAYSLSGDLRELVVADLRAERDRLAAALMRVADDSIDPPGLATSHDDAAPSLSSPEPTRSRPPARSSEDEGPPEPPRLHASWGEGRVVVWAGGPGVESTTEDLDDLLARAEGSGIGWEKHAPVPLPSGLPAEARSAPL